MVRGSNLMSQRPETGFLDDMSDNDTGYAPPPPGYAASPPGAPAAPRPPLRRTEGDEKVIAGVAGGIARTLGIDPILVRVAFVVLAIFGGSGILLYLAGWIFIPDETDTDAAGTKFFRDTNPLVIAAIVVVGVIVVGPLFAWGMWDHNLGFGGTVLLLLVVAGVVALTRRGGSATASPAATSSAASSTATTMPSDRPTTPLPPVVGAPPPPAPPQAPYSPPPQPPTPPPPPKDKSVLGRLTLGVALLVAGALVALDLGDVISVDAVTVIASALAVVAIGLLVGAFVGRARGLIVLGIVLTIVLIPLSAIPDNLHWNTAKGSGDQFYRVQSVDDLQDEYSLGAGKLTLDLRDLSFEPAQNGPAKPVLPTLPSAVEVSVGAGEVRVLLPPNDELAVTVDAEVGVGAIDLPGEPEHGGLGAEGSWESQPSAASTDPVLHLDLSSGLGKVTVFEQGVQR
jgi:phage shock protein PspC (stress-responsive transcriptional regulator)